MSLLIGALPSILKLLNSSEPQGLHLSNKSSNSNTYHIGLLSLEMK